MDTFYRDFDSRDRVHSAAVHLSAAAARLAVSIALSIPQLPERVWTEFRRLLAPEAIWAMCLVLAGWLIATAVGGVVGMAVNGLLLAYGVLELWDQLKSVSGEVMSWLSGAYYAKTREDLAAAGQHFAQALSVGGLTVIELLVTHRAFRLVEARLSRAIPTPEWLKGEFEKATKLREQPEPQTALRRKATVVRSVGAKRAATEIPTVALAVGGLGLGMAAVAAVALILASSNKRSS